MRSSTLLFVSIVSMMTLLLIPVIDDASAEQQRSIYVVQSGHDVELSVDLNHGESVVWDLGDGRIVRDPSVKTTYASGLYSVRAIISSSGEMPAILQKYVAIYDPVPPANSVIGAERNVEFRYSFFNGTSPSLKVLDAAGKVSSWLTYDAEQRVLTGIPRDSGHYYVFFGDKSWIVSVVDTGARLTYNTSFSLSADGNSILASPDSQYDTTSRYSWSIRDMNGTLTGYYEGRTLNLEVPNGYYTVHLQHTGVYGVSNYAKMVLVNGEITNEILTESKSFMVPTILIVLTIILMLIAFFRPIYAVFSAISGTIAIFSVIL